uniref:Lethal giant larvae (Lgl)-like C-terminal domain-containing protein n=1 Tax=Caenorhabditis japonica TaxID=281687 RepID=A0A8R1DWZ6_CAEJA
MQLSDSVSPTELENLEIDDHISTIGEKRHSNGFLHPHELPPRPNSSNGTAKTHGVIGLIRRNTSEFAATVRERYQGAHHSELSTDRPDVRQSGDDPRENKRNQKIDKSHSLKESFIRLVAKTSKDKKEFRCDPAEPTSHGKPERSRSLKVTCTHISEEWDSQRDSPSFAKQPPSSSPSTSSQSLQRSALFPAQDAITSLSFIRSHSKRNDSKVAPCLWVGTLSGASVPLNLIFPADRSLSTVVVAPSGTTVKMRGRILAQAFMDNSFCIVMPATDMYSETTKEPACTSPENSVSNKVNTKASLAPQYSDAVDVSDDISQILVVAAENEVKTIALPSFSQLFIQKFDEIPLIKASTTHIHGYPCLMCLSAAGQIVVLSLPSLRILQTCAFLPHSVDFDDAVCQKIGFSDHGLGVYMASQTELEKYTVSSEIAEQNNESIGELFVPCEMPEAPKNNSFLKGVSSIFGGSSMRNDPNEIDLILSENMGTNNSAGANSMRSVAKLIPGPSLALDRAQAGGISAGQAASMALQVSSAYYAYGYRTAERCTTVLYTRGETRN